MNRCQVDEHIFAGVVGIDEMISVLNFKLFNDFKHWLISVSRYADNVAVYLKYKSCDPSVICRGCQFVTLFVGMASTCWSPSRWCSLSCSSAIVSNFQASSFISVPSSH